jgi:hypothetical protein
MAEALLVFLTVEDPLGDETENAIEEAFGDLDWRLGGIGEVVGWDAAAEGLQLHLMAEEPERVIAVLAETLRALDVRPPSKLVASDPASGETLYERSLP